MFAIEVTTTFNASHQLRLPGGGVEPLHEHTWQVTARVESADLDELETVLDFHHLADALQNVCRPWNGGNLNEIEPFIAEWNPSAERVAQRVADLLGAALAPAMKSRARLAEIRLTEAPGCLAIYLCKA